MSISDKSKDNLKTFFMKLDQISKEHKIKLELIETIIHDDRGFLGYIEDNIDCYSIVINNEEIFTTNKLDN